MESRKKLSHSNTKKGPKYDELLNCCSIHALTLTTTKHLSASTFSKPVGSSPGNWKYLPEHLEMPFAIVPITNEPRLPMQWTEQRLDSQGLLKSRIGVASMMIEGYTAQSKLYCMGEVIYNYGIERYGVWQEARKEKPSQDDRLK